MTEANINGGVGTLIRAKPQGRPVRKELLEGFKLHPVGVEIRDWVDQRTWFEFGKLLQRIEYAWQWIVADWLAFGDHKYGDQVYQSATRLFGKSPRSWEDYAYIARNAQISERSEFLPVLTHKPVVRFDGNRKLQRTLLVVAEEHGLSKSLFEAVIELHLKGKSYQHLLPSQVTPLARARLRAEKERERVEKRVRAGGGDEWLQYAREQAEGWKGLFAELTARSRSA